MHKLDNVFNVLLEIFLQLFRLVFVRFVLLLSGNYSAFTDICRSLIACFVFFFLVIGSHLGLVFLHLMILVIVLGVLVGSRLVIVLSKDNEPFAE